MYIYDNKKELFQWELNQKVVVEDDKVKEVHFTNDMLSKALVVEVYEFDGKRVADIPNEILQHNFDIMAYGFCGENVRETLSINVIGRSKPEDYVYTETEIKTWDSLKEELEAEIEEIKNQPVVIDIYSNALKGAASGSAVAITDISPIEHTLEVKARVKNLISPDFTADKSANGITFTDNKDGTITVNGTATADVYYTPKFVSNAITLEIGKDYALSGVPQSGGISTYYMTVSSVDNSHYASDLGKGGKFTAKKEKYNLMIYIVKGATLDNVVFKPQIEEGTVATPYAPFVADVSTANVKQYGKNLFDGVYSLYQQPYYQIEMKDFIIPEQNKIYALSLDKQFTQMDMICEMSSGAIVRKAFAYGNTQSFFKVNGNIINWGNNNGVGATVTYDEPISKVRIYMYGDTSNGWDTEPKVQLEQNMEVTEYEPYKEPITYPINSNGSVENIKSIYPTTTLSTDTIGAVIDVNYNRDLNKAFEELIQAIISMGGNI